jgi:hypothetical protein
VLFSQYDHLPLGAQIAKPTNSHLCERAGHRQPMLAFSLLLRCYSTVLFAVISSLTPAASQGLCGELEIDG